MATLSERAAAIRERNRVLRSVPGSGYHDADVDFLGKLRAPHTRHLPGGQLPNSRPCAPVDEHVVAFYDVRDVVFVGPDAARVRGAVAAYCEQVRAKDPFDLTGTERALVHRILPRLAGGGDELRVWREDYNDVLHALDCMVVGTTAVPFVEE